MLTDLRVRVSNKKKYSAVKLICKAGIKNSNHTRKLKNPLLESTKPQIYIAELTYGNERSMIKITDEACSSSSD